MTRPGGWWRRPARTSVGFAGSLTLSALIALNLTACGGSDGRTADSTAGTQAARSSSSSDTVATKSGLVDIGAGRHVYADCAGTGTPTILLESGDESDTNQWAYVYPGLIEKTRVCRYDRLGNGESDPAGGCRELPDLRSDLEALLTELGEKGPYVLVGTSGGGYLLAGFAYAHSADIRGMVFVETPHAIVAARASPELLSELKCDSAENQERRDYVRVENDAWAHRHEIGDIPVTVISNDYGTASTNEEERTNVTGQKGWLVLSPRSRQVVVTTGHNVPENQPELVTKEILDVLDAARLQ